MAMDCKTAAVFGGTGFIGRYIVRELAKLGYRIKVVTRVPERAYFLRPCGTVGQIVPVTCDYSDPKSIEQAVSGADTVVNCIGILYEKKRGAFDKVHRDLPQAIAKACKKEGAQRFIHISALGIDKAQARYAKSKLDGEKAVRKAFKDVTILRPSVVFGPEDDFFNQFAVLSRYLPFLPLIGGGRTKFQPVYVGDVADAVMKAVTIPEGTKIDPRGRVYELGGPEIVSFREIYERLFHHTGRRRALMPLPWGLAKFQAFFFSLLPKPLLTPDQVQLLKTDNVVSSKAAGLADLDIVPTAMDLILPRYLGRYRPGGAFGDKKRA